MLRIDIGIQRVLGNSKIFGNLITGLGDEKRPILIEELDGLYLVILIHQRHRFANQSHGLLDEILQQIVDIDNPFRL